MDYRKKRLARIRRERAVAETLDYISIMLCVVMLIAVNIAEMSEGYNYFTGGMIVAILCVITIGVIQFVLKKGEYDD